MFGGAGRLATALVLLAAFGAAHVGVAPSALSSPHGRDVATFHYAAVAASRGLDPYDRASLSGIAASEGTRRDVYPLLYPPTFLPLVAWMSGLALMTSYAVSFVGNALAALIAAVAVAATRPGRGPLIALAVVALGAPVANNALMGQANLPALAACAAGLALVSRGHRGWGGALVGVAVGIKLVPLAILGWWALRGRGSELLGAAVGLALLAGSSLVLYGPGPWVTFLTEVGPSLLGGDHNGLALEIARFGNHGLAELWHRALPSAGPGLSGPARAGLAASGAAALAWMAWSWRRPSEDAEAEAARVGALLALPLLLATYTWEHHLVWAIPAVVAGWRGALDRRLGAVGVAALVLATLGWAVDLEILVAAAGAVGEPLSAVVREAKCAALVAILLLATRLGGRS
jgi:hypothetical protein